MRFHVLGVPHTITTPEYSTCAFTQKVVKLCKMLKARGHYVIHYGHADSNVACDEHVTVTTAADLQLSYGAHDWRRDGWPNFKLTDTIYRTFFTNSIRAIAERKQRGDFLLCQFGAGHKPVADAHGDLIVVEPGIGYPGGSFAPFRVFESYAIKHAYYGCDAIETARNDFWNDAVIPNFFDVSDFKFSATKKDYLLFLGRVGVGKGAHIAGQLAEATGRRLITAGPGDKSIFGNSSLIEHVGVVGPAERKKLLAGAAATLCPSTFLEPFCGVQVESFLSGTPVISSDWGAFAEYNLHGRTGYRCRTFSQFVSAVESVHKLKSRDCRKWGLEFSLEKIGPLYDEFFTQAADVMFKKGWYEPHPERTDLGPVVFR